VALQRHQWSIDDGGADNVVVEFLPAEWPRSPWEVLQLVADRETGWRDIDETVAGKLRRLFNGAHGTAERGLRGLIVQYVEGTGRGPFYVADWTGRVGLFVFLPDTGLELAEVHGAGGYYTAVLRLVPVSSASIVQGIASAEAFGQPTIG
jgi:hypothetical protein